MFSLMEAREEKENEVGWENLMKMEGIPVQEWDHDEGGVGERGNTRE